MFFERSEGKKEERKGERGLDDATCVLCHEVCEVVDAAEP